MATWSQTDIDALKAAVASGVLIVRYADRSVTYQSLEAMRALLAEMRQDVARASGTPTTRYVSVRKGV